MFVKCDPGTTTHYAPPALWYGADLAQCSNDGIMARSHAARRGSIVRPNAHDWKSCEGNTSAGSNPALSANAGKAPQVESRLWRFCCPLASHAAILDPPPQQPRAGWVPPLPGTCVSTSSGRPGAGPSPRLPLHCWRRHQQYPSAIPSKSWHNANPALGCCRTQRPYAVRVGNLKSRTAARQLGAAEARLTYWSACRETKHSLSCRTRSSANKKPGFTEQIAA